MTELVFTTWKSLTETKIGVESKSTWPQFVELMSERRPFAGKNKHPGWSAARFRDGHRKADHVVEVTALVLDFDHGFTIENACDELVFGDCLGLLVTTKSHTESEPAFRVILPLSRPVTPAEYQKIWQVAACSCDNKLAQACKDPCRFWYMPGVLKDDSPFVVKQLDGHLMNVDDTLQAYLEMLEDWQFEPTPAPVAAKQASKPRKSNGKRAGTSNYVGRGILHAVFTARGLLLDDHPDGSGTFAQCPWASAHTAGKGDATSTILWHAKPGHEMGLFACKHSHCTHRTIDDVLALFPQAELDAARVSEGLPPWKSPRPKAADLVDPNPELLHLGDDVNGSDGVTCKPKIVIGVDIEKMVDVCVPVLAELNIYQADNRLVRLMNVSAEEAERRKVKNYAGSPVMRPAEAAHIKAVLSSNIEWIKERKDRKGEIVECPAKPDADAVAALLERGTYSSIRYLIGLKGAPFFRPDGSVCTTPGYDESTAMYLSLEEHCPDVPNKPTPKDAQSAIAELIEVFADFPHASVADKLVPVAAILTILARPAIEGPVPGFAFDANRPRTGKGMQANAVSLIATAREWSSASWTSDDIETRKILDGWALDGAELVGFDDVNGSDDFNCAALRSYLTQTSIQVRRLGYSGNVNCNWRGVILATGNSMRIRKDMRGRLLRSGLESQEPHPEQRKDFKHSPLIPWVKVNQPRLLRAALVALRAWFANGRPQVIDETLGSFESWAQIIPQVIGLATGQNIFQCVPSIGEASEEDTFLARLVEALRTRGERTAAALFDDSGFCELVREVRHGKTFTVGDVGLVLRGFKHQAVDLEDGRFWIDASAPSKTGGVKWKVAKLAEPNQSDHAAEGGDGGSLPLRVRKSQVSNFIEEGARYPQPPPTSNDVLDEAEYQAEHAWRGDQ